MTINWDDFEKIDIRVGTILKAQPFLKAKKPAYQLVIDFGVLGIKIHPHRLLIYIIWKI
jgi:tRNA-binding protein